MFPDKYYGIELNVEEDGYKCVYLCFGWHEWSWRWR